LQRLNTGIGEKYDRGPNIQGDNAVERITQTIERLQHLCRTNILTNWRFSEADLSIDRAVRPETWQNWQSVTLNSRKHIPWTRGKQVLWLSQTLVVPPRLNRYNITGFALRLSLRWWAEDAQLYVNGILVREGDLFDCFGRVLLSSSVRPGDVFHFALRLVSPGHDDGALVTSECVYESDAIDPGFIADEIGVCGIFSNPKNLQTLADCLKSIDWDALPERQEDFDRSLGRLRQILKTECPKPPISVSLLGHAHLDMAWLWPVSETWDAAQRTFESVLNLQNEFPELIFSHSSPALYDWIEINRPNLFSKIQDRVRSGVWEVAAGLWVEPEFNLVSGESIARQILYGQRYTEAKFGTISRVAWLPDSFGFCWQLPQLLKLGGIDYFVTQKLQWNDTTKFPEDWFLWESPDGTQIHSWMCSPIGQSIEPKQIAEYAANWLEKTAISELLWLPGVGDHGGGPTRDMLQVARRWQKSPILPPLQFSTAIDYLDRMASRSRKLPVWRDELYLEYHRGCYTTHADRKLANRHGERLLYRAELFASIASIVAGVPYPKTDLETAWKLLLFDQFHDILPGSAIPEVFVDADRSSQEIDRLATGILEASLATLTERVALPQPPHPEAIPLFCVNATNLDRSEVVSIEVPDPSKTWQVCDMEGNPVKTRQNRETLLVYAKKIPEIGLSTFWVYSSLLPVRNYEYPDCRTFIYNCQLRVEIDKTTGNLTSIFHVPTQRELLDKTGGNRLEFYEDKGQYWDAWNIDPNYSEKRLESATLEKIEWIEYGELRQHLRVVRRFRQSRFVQDYVLDIDTPVLKIATHVDWQERHVLVKAAFGFNLETDTATYEMPFGSIDRPTRPQTDAEKAKWEVPALQWADLSTSEFGVSLLNDCKHGYDAKPNQLRLTLLRGSVWPDPDADLGEHEFTYGIYPHSGDWREGETVRQGYEFNQPLSVKLGTHRESRGELSPQTSWVTGIPKNFIVTTLKQAEDSSRGWILRGYECHGRSSQFQIGGSLGFKDGVRVDILERDMGGNAEIHPWQVASFRYK